MKIQPILFSLPKKAVIGIFNRNNAVRCKIAAFLIFLLILLFCVNISAQEEAAPPPSDVPAAQEPAASGENVNSVSESKVEGLDLITWKAADILYHDAEKLREDKKFFEAKNKINAALNLTKNAIPNSTLRRPYIEEQKQIVSEEEEAKQEKAKQEEAKQAQGTDCWGKWANIASIVAALATVVGIFIPIWLFNKSNNTPKLSEPPIIQTEEPTEPTQKPDTLSVPQDPEPIHVPIPTEEKPEIPEPLTNPVEESTEPPQEPEPIPDPIPTEEKIDEKKPNKRKARTRKTLTIRGVKYPFRWCPKGSFWMGSPPNEAERDDDETRHRVTLSHGFWMLETAVTQKMWKSIMGDNPSCFKGDNLPVECVSWNDCQDFIKKLNEGSGIPSGYKMSLPTEAQWEYACRAGTDTPFSFGSILNGDKANCDGNYPYGTETKGNYLEETSAVKSYSANKWGLYDMHGNVWEWCLDWYDEDYYTNSPETDPIGPDSGSNRV